MLAGRNPTSVVAILTATADELHVSNLLADEHVGVQMTLYAGKVPAVAGCVERI